MSKHLWGQKDSLKNMWTSEFKRTFTFNPNGAWSSTYWRRGYGTTVTTGHWKIIDKGEKIRLFKNRFLPPDDKAGTVADHSLNVLRLTGTEFVTNEYMFAEDPVGISYYQRTKSD